jgi:exopolyphosphatase/guanosine-5'-triphosphate,3'-diphosphate pyrophosphatase
VNAGVVDVGSNTVRLLVARPSPSGLVRVRQEKAYVGLGAELIRNGRITEAKLAEAAAVAGEFARIARKEGSDPLEVIVTAPGRQASNGDELLDELARATRAPVRLLTAEEEGLLAYRGAVAAESGLAGPVAVCDTGGGSTEIVVGVPPDEPSWVRSVDVGSLRLTAAFLSGDPPGPDELEAARSEAALRLGALTPPLPHSAIAVGGSARALARLVGRTLDERALADALDLAVALPAAEVASLHGLDEQRARVLAAGAVILREVVRLLGVPLRLARGGLREGAIDELVAERLAA